ncbi:hypothetical protein MRX96_011340 [Rhipicephalus microplus]
MRRYISKDLADSVYDYDGTSAGIDMPSEWRARAHCMQLSEKLVGQFTFSRFIQWKTVAEDYLYVSSMVEAISQMFTRAVTDGSGSGERSKMHVADTDFHVEFHEATMRVVDEGLRNYGLSNVTSFLNNWMDITAAASTINATFRDRISTTFTKDLIANQRYSFYNKESETLSLPPPLFSMLPLYRRELGETAKFGSLGTLFTTAIF